jgi:translation initiation factor 3 subunit L
LFPLNLFDKTHLYTPTISSCHIALFYYASFGYLMLQRYTDAGK